MNKVLRRSAALVLLLLPGQGFASDLIYNPTNPAFGGFPGNFDFLVGTAQIQNKFAEGGGGNGGPPVINFPPIDIDIGGIGGAPDGGDGGGENGDGGDGETPVNGNGDVMENGDFTVSN